MLIQSLLDFVHGCKKKQQQKKTLPVDSITDQMAGASELEYTGGNFMI